MPPCPPFGSIILHRMFSFRATLHLIGALPFTCHERFGPAAWGQLSAVACAGAASNRSKVSTPAMTVRMLLTIWFTNRSLQHLEYAALQK
jgi:hypothetical protein